VKKEMECQTVVIHGERVGSPFPRRRVIKIAGEVDPQLVERLLGHLYDPQVGVSTDNQLVPAYIKSLLNTSALDNKTRVVSISSQYIKLLIMSNKYMHLIIFPLSSSSDIMYLRRKYGGEWNKKTIKRDDNDLLFLVIVSKICEVLKLLRDASEVIGLFTGKLNVVKEPRDEAIYTIRLQHP